ncbi:DUF1003 domain-containing protein [Microbacter margulisiae]|uniref:Putative membrane protein n=1 Tax=Microbacter margulisiae TaxID=1350067 RepID=A0A7W5DSP3_9PORP|nr:DUF1003 domain-containing protein [Microbacter margulisiae]MBB3188362.1 putative membrane protein [Microbacter margulisiae]
MATFISDLSKKEFPVSERIAGTTLRPSILDLIRKDHPDFTRDQSLSTTELNHYREKHILHSLGKDKSKLNELEKKVVSSLTKRKTLTDQLQESEAAESPTFGQRIADKVASFGGSWTFILSFLGFLLIWIAINAFWLSNKGFDPYPFILLNLILSCIAAIQAPVIMMSQNRQEAKDRDRAQKDYMINLKSELEIQVLHEKIEHILEAQQQAFINMQQEHTEMMNAFLKQQNTEKTE